MDNHTDSQVTHELARLKALLEDLANADDSNYPTCIDRILFDYRDCRLQLILLLGNALTDEQRHHLQQLEWRLDGIATNQLTSGAVPHLAKLALASFGWTQAP